jgi:glutamate synthase domain-containing protein 3
VKWLIERHLELTGSVRASELLKVWDQAAEMLWHILPWDRPERHQRVEAHRVSAS